MKKNILMVSILVISLFATLFFVGAGTHAFSYTFSVSTDQTMSLKQVIPAGTNDVLMGAYRVYSREDIIIKKIVLHAEGSALPYLKSGFSIETNGWSSGFSTSSYSASENISFDSNLLVKGGSFFPFLVKTNLDKSMPNGKKMQITVASVEAYGVKTGELVQGIINSESLVGGQIIVQKSAIYARNVVISKELVEGNQEIITFVLSATPDVDMEFKKMSLILEGPDTAFLDITGVYDVTEPASPSSTLLVWSGNGEMLQNGMQKLQKTFFAGIFIPAGTSKKFMVKAYVSGLDSGESLKVQIDDVVAYTYIDHAEVDIYGLPLIATTVK